VVLRGRASRGTDDPDSGQPARLRLVGEDVYPDWEAIYRDNVSRIYRLIYAKVGNAPDAEDLTTEVFLAALGPLRAAATVGEVRAYLLATARTALAAHWRRTLGRQITTLDEQSVASVFEPAPPGSNSSARVEAILAELPEQYQRILRLRFLESCTIKQSATELGITVSNAKVLQHRALRRAALVADRMEG
jgi:RNA polymerase sigma-70 factor, ECF subfamily